MKQCEITKCDQLLHSSNELSVLVKMKGSTSISSLALLILTIVVLVNVHHAYGGLIEPYKVLGIHRRASVGEIRKAYKQLAKEWHPDKVSGGQEKKTAAEAKFIEINRAYELLRLVLMVIS